MKLSLKFLFLFLSAGNIAAAQKTPVVNVYAYMQPVLPGAKKTVIVQENGGTIESAPQKKVNYFFYAEQKKSEQINIVGIWMYGKKYLAGVNAVSSTPIEISSEDSTTGSHKISLLPAVGSGNKILQILPGASATKGTQLPRALKKMVYQHELVLIYVWKGKTWYLPVKRIKIMSPAPSV